MSRISTYHMEDKMSSQWLWILRKVIVHECMCKSQMYNVLTQCKSHIEDVTGPLECIWK